MKEIPEDEWAWLEDRFKDYIKAVCGIEDALRKGDNLIAGMEVVQLRHMLLQAYDNLRKMGQEREA